MVSKAYTGPAGKVVPAVLGIADVAQSVERVLGKDEVMGSNPISSSMYPGRPEWLAEDIEAGESRSNEGCVVATVLETSGTISGGNC